MQTIKAALDSRFAKHQLSASPVSEAAPARIKVVDPTPRVLLNVP